MHSVRYDSDDSGRSVIRGFLRTKHKDIYIKRGLKNRLNRKIERRNFGENKEKKGLQPLVQAGLVKMTIPAVFIGIWLYLFPKL